MTWTQRHRRPGNTKQWEPKDSKKIQSFLQTNRLLQSLFRTPTQMDALCLIWDEALKVNLIPEKMTEVYNAIVEPLWKRVIKRLKWNLLNP